jgi:hypothetical protein
MEVKMQNDLFKEPETDDWVVVEKKEELIWNEQNKMFDTFPVYVHTRPKNWRGPDESEKLPWEE